MSQLPRRQVLKSAGLTAGAFAFPRRAIAQTKPGTLISAQTTEATGLDPQLVPALSRSRRSPLTYNQLVRFEPDMTPTPELAESWSISPDGLTWTFKLRQGVKWHDGQEFTSADVKFSFDRLLEKSAAGKSDFNAVDKIEPAGKYAVKFVTKEPFAALVAALGGFWGFIVSEAGVKKHADLNKAALGTGPFILDDWKVEQQMVFKRNPNYWKKGLPHVDELIVRVIPDEANIVAALRTGQVHHAFIEDNKNYNLLKDEKSLTGYRSSRLGYDYLNMSANRRPPRHLPARRGAGPPGRLGGGRPRAGDAGRHRRLRAAHRAVHGAHEAVAIARGAVDEVLQARPRARQEADGRGRRAQRLQREVLGDPHL